VEDQFFEGEISICEDIIPKNTEKVNFFLEIFAHFKKKQYLCAKIVPKI